MEIDRKSIGTLIKELTTVTVLCFMAQERIKVAQTVEEKAAAGDDAQSLNAKINQYIRALDQRLGESEITPTPKSYANKESRNIEIISDTQISIFKVMGYKIGLSSDGFWMMANASAQPMKRGLNSENEAWLWLRDYLREEGAIH